jgi:hypothetical protein
MLLKIYNENPNPRDIRKVVDVLGKEGLLFTLQILFMVLAVILPIRKQLKKLPNTKE